MFVIETRGDYLFVEYDGPNEPEHLIPLMELVAKRAREENCRKILADLRRTPSPMKMLDRFDLGVLAAELFRGIARFAIVTPKNENDLFGESVAINRGLPTRIMHDMQEAIDWLDGK